MTDIKKIVYDNLDNSRDNGYFEKGEQLHGANAEEIADDMMAFSADCEKLNAEQLKPHVETWLELNRREKLI